MSTIMKTSELVVKFKEELATGRPVVFQIQDEVVNGNILVHIAQQFETPIYNLPGSMGGLVGELFSQEPRGQLIRFIQAVPESAPDDVKKVFTKEGVMPEGINIQVEHTTKPTGKKAYTPIYRNNSWIENAEGKLVFENCQPVRGEAKHSVFATYRLSDRRETPDEMKEYVHNTWYTSAAKIPAVVV